MNISETQVDVRIEAEPKTPANGAAESPPRVLLADDDSAVRDSLALVLQSEGYEVIQARDGKEAVRFFEQYPPDLILLDLNMPRQNGWSAFEAMESVRPLVPCIVITAKPHQRDCAQGHGIDALMEKPLDIPQLLDLMRQLLEESQDEHIARVTSSSFQTLCIESTAGRQRRRRS